MNEQDNQNIFCELERSAQRLPYKRAIVASVSRDASGRYAYVHVTFAAFLDEVLRVSAGLCAAGITAGTRVLMMVPPSIEFGIISYALFRLGAVPVYVDGGNALPRLLAMIKDADPGAFVGTAAALGLRRASPELFAAMKSFVVGGEAEGAIRHEDLRSGGHPPCPTARLGAEDLMAILFTSGSTGAPKGVEYTPRMFRTIPRPMKEVYDVDENDIDLMTFPIDLLAAPTLGMTVIVPDMDATAPGKVDPPRIIQIIHEQGCTYSLGSPAFWNRIVQHCIDHEIKLPSLRRVLLAGAPVPGDLLRRFAEVVPNVRCYTPIGATECGQLAVMDGRDILTETSAKTDQGRGVCVGLPFKDHELRVIEITNEVIPDWQHAKVLDRGQIGELVLKGLTVSPRYWRQPEATRRAKIYEENGAVWHRMGDVGYQDEAGRLWFCGRVAHIVHHAGQRYYPIMVESIFNAEPDIWRTALLKASGNRREALVLCVEFKEGRLPASPEALAERVARLKASADSAELPLTDILVHEQGFPVDARHNAKIEYQALTDWAATRLGLKA